MQDYFGEPWPSGLCEGGTQVPTPIGQPCLFCDQKIVQGDQGGFMREVHADPDWPQEKWTSELRAVHRECQLCDVKGGYGHHTDHEYWCLRRRDPHGGLPYRESALRVWEIITGEHMPRDRVPTHLRIPFDKVEGVWQHEGKSCEEVHPTELVHAVWEHHVDSLMLGFSEGRG